MEKSKYIQKISVKVGDELYASFENFDENKRPLEIESDLHQSLHMCNIVDDSPSQTSMRIRSKTLWTLELIKRSHRLRTGKVIFHGEIIEKYLAEALSFTLGRPDFNFEKKDLARVYFTQGEACSLFLPHHTFHDGRVQSLLYLSLLDLDLLFEREKAIINWILNNAYFNENAKMKKLSPFKISRTNKTKFNNEELINELRAAKINFKHLNIFFHNYTDTIGTSIERKSQNFTAILDPNIKIQHYADKIEYFESEDIVDNWGYTIVRPWDGERFFILREIGKICGKVEKREDTFRLDD